MYKLTPSPTTVQRLADNVFIPMAEGNRDYQEYLAWLAAGNTPEPYVEPVPTPAELLAKLDADNALTQRNLRETVMLMAEAFKTITSGTVDLSAIPGVAKVYEVEAQAAALREQL